MVEFFTFFIGVLASFVGGLLVQRLFNFIKISQDQESAIRTWTESVATAGNEVSKRIKLVLTAESAPKTDERLKEKEKLPTILETDYTEYLTKRGKLPLKKGTVRANRTKRNTNNTNNNNNSGKTTKSLSWGLPTSTRSSTRSRASPARFSPNASKRFKPRTTSESTVTLSDLSPGARAGTVVTMRSSTRTKTDLNSPVGYSPCMQTTQAVTRYDRPTAPVSSMSMSTCTDSSTGTSTKDSTTASSRATSTGPSMVVSTNPATTTGDSTAATTATSTGTTSTSTGESTTGASPLTPPIAEGPGGGLTPSERKADSVTAKSSNSLTRTLTNRMLCDCGLDILTEEQEKLLEERDAELPDAAQPLEYTNKTIIRPFSYEAYKPMDFTSPNANKQTSLRRGALMIPPKSDPINVLTPFKPVLHTIYYANRHGYVLDDLIQNYQFLEDY